MDKIIITLLSNQRNKDNLAMPAALNKTQIISLIKESFSPKQLQQNSDKNLEESLQELEAQGEILKGTRNRYCIAPPAVLSLEQDELNNLCFRGDRAYLPLAHRVLETQQNSEDTFLYSKISNSSQIKQSLNPVGIRFLTLEESFEYLPKPCQPSQAILRSPWPDNPLELGIVKQYTPSLDAAQKERWQSLNQQQLSERTLLQLTTGEYLWFQDNNFYELEPDMGVLTMFYQDRERQCPLKIEWDKAQGKLSLQGIFLPHAYYRLLLQLSKPDPQRYRTRCIQPRNQPLIETAFQRLGCLLV